MMTNTPNTTKTCLTQSGIRRKFLIFCSLPKNSGSYVMGKYMAKAISRYHNVSYVKSFGRLPFNLYYIVSIPVYVIKSILTKSDVTLVLKPFPAPCIAAFLQKKIYGAKIVLDIDDIDYGYTKSISNILKYIQSMFVDKFDLIFVHNEELVKRVQQDFGIGKDKLFIRGQGVDTAIFKPMDVPKKQGKKTIIFTGHLNASSYLEEILKAFKLASIKKKNIQIVVVGDGYKKSRYEKMSKRLGIDAMFLGYISDQNRIASLIAQSDACIVYYPETLGNKYRCSMKLREYLAMGKPAVCNDFGDLKRFKKYTYNSKTGNLEALSEQIIKALFNPDKRSLSGMSYVRKSLSWDSVVSDMLKKMENA